MAVVDPGVGTKRRPILIETKESFFVGPDNGLLILAAQSQDIKHVYQLTNPQFMLPNVSCTFSGRDIFAPAAAYLEKGVKPAEFGFEIFDVVEPNFANVKSKNGTLIGEVLYIDSFGNIITNISKKELSQFGISARATINITLKHQKSKIRIVTTYADTKQHKALLLIGSHSFLELALNQGSTAKRFHAKAGDRIEVSVE